MYTILLIEDDDTLRMGISQVLKKNGFKVFECASGPKGLDLFRHYHQDMVITDYKMEPMNGLDVLREIKQLSPATAVIMITAYGTPEIMVSAEQLGASEFIFKPFAMVELEVRVKKTVQLIQERDENQRNRNELQYLREELGVVPEMVGMIGNSVQMQTIFQKIQKIAQTDSSVLIYGESGTGKELVARAIHFSSKRKNKPFIRVNCGALAPGVLESELFGHEKGSFTGAINQRLGRFELAHSGSIFLDEIGEIPLEIQVKLLRVLQEKEFERVGGEKTLTVDVRVIAATHKDLKKEIEEKKFREDLYYRLHIIPIELPPLRERKEDIPELVHHFVKKISKELQKPDLAIEDTVVEFLKRYHWPGNIRELENAIERAAVLCESPIISLNDFAFLNQDRYAVSDNEIPDPMDLYENITRLEKDLIEKALHEAGNNKTEASRILGIKTSTLYYKMEKYGLPQ